MAWPASDAYSAADRLAALRAHPDFRVAAERNAAAIAALHDRLSPRERWLTKDMGRVAVLSRIVFQDARAGRVTAADILATTRARGTSSQGRALQVIQRAEAAGWLEVEPGDGDWKQRRLRVQSGLMEVYRRRAAVEIETAALLAPAIAPAAALTVDDAFLLSFLSQLARFESAPPQPRGPPMPSMRFFLQHEAGLPMLYDLIGRQAPDRGRLLESAYLSRRALASRFQVARSHVERLFAQAADAGYITLPARNRVDFSPTMSDEAERHFALTFQVIAASASAVLDGATTG
ncbi:MAG: hypothetical protein JWQ29_625 [Phenylobacterium sp.]|nr:hypothetical protein [Phenylobacterium sp.]